jgi:5-methylcytosine-specific restriction endonuclease McrA
MARGTSRAGETVTLGDALVLNATYEPLCVVPQRRAIVLVLTSKAVVVEGTEGALRSPTRRVDIPAVVRLSRFVRVPYRAEVPLTRKGVLARDGHRCAYCGAPATSLDHVIPRSRGGAHSWDNVVAACGRCNHTKADRFVADLGWRLASVPKAPSGTAWRVLGTRRVDPRWSAYLDGYLPQAVSA